MIFDLIIPLQSYQHTLSLNDYLQYLPISLLVAIPSLIITEIIELIVGALTLFLIRNPKKIRLILTILLANFLSVFIIWGIFPLLSIFKIHFLIILVLAEIFAILFEAQFIYLLNKQFISPGSARILSMLTNSSSIIVGLLLLGMR